MQLFLIGAGFCWFRAACGCRNTPLCSRNHKRMIEMKVFVRFWVSITFIVLLDLCLGHSFEFASIYWGCRGRGFESYRSDHASYPYPATMSCGDVLINGRRAACPCHWSFSPTLVKGPCQICSVANANDYAEERYKPQQRWKDELSKNCQHQLILVAVGSIPALLAFSPGFRSSTTFFGTTLSGTSGRLVS